MLGKKREEKESLVIMAALLLSDPWSYCKGRWRRGDDRE